jgi:hypothetical protein
MGATKHCDDAHPAEAPARGALARLFAAGLAVLLSACGDDAQATDAATDAPADAAIDADPTPRPDLVLVEEMMRGTVAVTDQVFEADACELVEACVGAPGARRLLTFTTATGNLGTADLHLGPPDPENPIFQFSPCHGHYHVVGFANYDLVGLNGVVVSGHKQAFCLMDIEPIEPGTPTQGYACEDQGISMGWADLYWSKLPCQWIDVTGVPPGPYTLRIQVNPDHTLLETNYDNNTVEFDVLL